MLALISAPTAASAQEVAAAFIGPHLGPAAGTADHHFVLETSGDGLSRQFNVTRWGVAGEVFAGYDLAIAPRIVVGGEVAADFGGRAAVERNSSYSFGLDPRYGFSLSARIGYVATSRLMLYGGGGYGGHDYRVISSVPTAGDAAFARTRSFLLRVGVEYRLARRVNARLEFQHLDGSRNQFMLGLPIRF